MAETLRISAGDARAVALVQAIRAGSVEEVERQLRAEPQLVNARIVDDEGVARTPLHVLADWPGHFPNGAQTVALLVAAGADPNAPVLHPGAAGSPETPLHWAASSDDVAVLDALLDGGADIEATGAVFTGGTAMSDAVVFAQWRAARRLLERGATTTIWQAAALGQVERVRALCSADPPPTARDITNAFWHACRGGELGTAELLFERGADVNWMGHERKTAMDVAREGGHERVVRWLGGLPGR